MNGVGVGRDEKKAFGILEEVEEKSIFARYLLGLCYFNGTGTERDYGRAVKLFKECPNFYDKALNKLGECYYFGYGVENDKEEARKFWQQAVAYKSEQAAENLKKYFNETSENE